MLLLFGSNVKVLDVFMFVSSRRSFFDDTDASRNASKCTSKYASTCVKICVSDAYGRVSDASFASTNALRHTFKHAYQNAATHRDANNTS